MTGGGQASAIRIEGQSPYGPAVVNLQDFCAARDIPDPDYGVSGTGGQTGPVRTKGHNTDRVQPAFQLHTDHLGSRGRIPDPDHMVVATGGQTGPVRTKRHRTDPAPTFRSHTDYSGPRGRIPDPDHMVVATGGQTGPVRTKGHRKNRGLVVPSADEFFAGGGVPDPSRVVATPGG